MALSGPTGQLEPDIAALTSFVQRAQKEGVFKPSRGSRVVKVHEGTEIEHLAFKALSKQQIQDKVVETPLDVKEIAQYCVDHNVAVIGLSQILTQYNQKKQKEKGKQIDPELIAQIWKLEQNKIRDAVEKGDASQLKGITLSDDFLAKNRDSIQPDKLFSEALKKGHSHYEVADELKNKLKITALSSEQMLKFVSISKEYAVQVKNQIEALMTKEDAPKIDALLKDDTLNPVKAQELAKALVASGSIENLNKLLASNLLQKFSIKPSELLQVALDTKWYEVADELIIRFKITPTPEQAKAFGTLLKKFAITERSRTEAFVKEKAQEKIDELLGSSYINRITAQEFVKAIIQSGDIENIKKLLANDHIIARSAIKPLVLLQMALTNGLKDAIVLLIQKFNITDVSLEEFMAIDRAKAEDRAGLEKALYNVKNYDRKNITKIVLDAVQNRNEELLLKLESLNCEAWSLLTGHNSPSNLVPADSPIKAKLEIVKQFRDGQEIEPEKRDKIFADAIKNRDKTFLLHLQKYQYKDSKDQTPLKIIEQLPEEELTQEVKNIAKLLVYNLRADDLDLTDKTIEFLTKIALADNDKEFFLHLQKNFPLSTGKTAAQIAFQTVGGIRSLANIIDDDAVSQRLFPHRTSQAKEFLKSLKDKDFTEDELADISGKLQVIYELNTRKLSLTDVQFLAKIPDDEVFLNVIFPLRKIMSGDNEIVQIATIMKKAIENCDEEVLQYLQSHNIKDETGITVLHHFAEGIISAREREIANTLIKNNTFASVNSIDTGLLTPFRKAFKKYEFDLIRSYIENNKVDPVTALNLLFSKLVELEGEIKNLKSEDAEGNKREIATKEKLVTKLREMVTVFANSRFQMQDFAKFIYSSNLPSHAGDSIVSTFEAALKREEQEIQPENYQALSQIIKKFHELKAKGTSSTEALQTACCEELLLQGEVDFLKIRNGVARFEMPPSAVSAILEKFKGATKDKPEPLKEPFSYMQKIVDYCARAKSAQAKPHETLRLAFLIEYEVAKVGALRDFILQPQAVKEGEFVHFASSDTPLPMGLKIFRSQHKVYVITKELGTGAFKLAEKVSEIAIDKLGETPKTLVRLTIKDPTDLSGVEDLLKEVTVLGEIQGEGVVRLEALQAQLKQEGAEKGTDVLIKALQANGILVEFASSDLLKVAKSMSKEGATDDIGKVRENLGYFVDILKGIKRLHGAGYVWGDAKPENCLIVLRDGKQVAVLTDFGTAFNLLKGDSPYSTFTILGLYATPSYTAAELLLKRGEIPKDFDYQKTDLWAAGMILKELYDGKMFGWTADIDRTKLEALRADPKQFHKQVKEETTDVLSKLEAIPEQNRTEAQKAKILIYKLLDGLTNTDPAKRWNADQALSEAEKGLQELDELIEPIVLPQKVKTRKIAPLQTVQT